MAAGLKLLSSTQSRLGSPSACASDAATASRTTRSISGASRASTARSMSLASASRAAPPGGGGAGSATTCVSTGTSTSSCASLIVCREVVVADLVAARLVEAVAGAAGLALGIVAGHYLEQALEALEVRRAFGTQVEDQLAVRGRLRVGRDQDRRIGGERIVQRAVRHERGSGPGPHQLVDAA